MVHPSASFVVVNAYTQFDYRGAGVRVDYDASGEDHTLVELPS